MYVGRVNSHRCSGSSKTLFFQGQALYDVTDVNRPV